ncbi:hypothetical protein WJ32_08220 [Burkholderia ubonensis]|uniref:Uncharacterized protein n=1 Tax=Burkholderia ubonensis TaxID=101571 RepID=A0A118HLK7_9BURK|nr:hypothetical protein WJ32_08220 [Burkholderia ubonensis]KVG56406.1 hypothetical protein WJ33_36885 [Burkholderia ubonensis]
MSRAQTLKEMEGFLARCDAITEKNIEQPAAAPADEPHSAVCITAGGLGDENCICGAHQRNEARRAAARNIAYVMRLEEDAKKWKALAESNAKLAEMAQRRADRAAVLSAGEPADERAAFDVALAALNDYQGKWDTGMPMPYAQSERIAMECACEAVRDALEEARAAASPAASIPAGYALVPIEPTDAMIESGAAAGVPDGEGLYYPFSADEIGIAYCAMIAARPRAPQPAQADAPAEAREPVDMLLFCPKCGTQHIDGPEVGDIDTGNGIRDDVQWANPPHRSHLCHACGTIWRPADVPTNGVAAIQTRGMADTWDGAISAPADAGEAVGCLTVKRFRGADSMVNTDFDYYGDLPDGSYQCYTAPPAARVASLTDDQIAATARQHATSFVDGDDAITDLFFEGSSYLEFARALLAPTQQPSGKVTEADLIDSLAVGSSQSEFNADQWAIIRFELKQKLVARAGGAHANR